MTGVKIKESWNGKLAIVDGYQGELIVEPDKAVLEEYQKLQKQDKEQKELLQSIKGKENVTLSWSEDKTVCKYRKYCRFSSRFAE